MVSKCEVIDFCFDFLFYHPQTTLVLTLAANRLIPCIVPYIFFVLALTIVYECRDLSTLFCAWSHFRGSQGTLQLSPLCFSNTQTLTLAHIKMEDAIFVCAFFASILWAVRGGWRYAWANRVPLKLMMWLVQLHIAIKFTFLSSVTIICTSLHTMPSGDLRASSQLVGPCSYFVFLMMTWHPVMDVVLCVRAFCFHHFLKLLQPESAFLFLFVQRNCPTLCDNNRGIYSRIHVKIHIGTSFKGYVELLP